MEEKNNWGKKRLTGGFTKPWHRGLVVGYFLQTIAVHKYRSLKKFDWIEPGKWSPSHEVILL